MRLAVLAQPVGEGLDPPLLDFGDLAAHLLDHAFELGGQFLDLLRADVLAREHDVFVKRHANAFPMLRPSWRQALRALSGKARKQSRRREHRTPDHAVLPAIFPSGTSISVGKPRGRPFSSRPGTSGSAGYKVSAWKRKLCKRRCLGCGLGGVAAFELLQ